MTRPAKNFLSLFIGSIGSRLLGFLVTVYLARILDVSGFGKISFALAIFSYGVILTNPGLLLLGTREVAKKKEKIGEYLPTIVVLRLLLALFAFLLILSLLIFLPKSQDTKVLIFFYSLSLLAQVFLLEWLYQGIEEMEYIGISRLSVFFFYLPLVFLFVKDSQKILWVPLFWLIGNIVASLFLMFIFWKRFGTIRLRFNPSLLLPLLRKSLPLGLAAIMIQIYLYFDTLLLGFFKGDESVGWYNSAYKLVFFVLLLDRVFTETIFPLIARYYIESIEKLKRLLVRYVKLIIALVLPIGVGGTLLASPIMNLVYGPRYEDGVFVFQILIWAVSLSSVNSVYGYGLIGCNREKSYTFAVTIGTIANILLNLLLIPRFGLVGAAWVKLFSEGIIFTLMVIQFEKIVQIQFWKYIPKPFLAAISMGVLIHLLRYLHPLLLIFVGCITYLILLFMIRGFAIEEIPILRRK